MLICKNCNIEYEDGKKFCKHCGDPLTPKEEPFTTKKKPKKTEEEDSGGKLICPVCKIVYEFGSSCIQCGSPLAHQIHSDANEEPETAPRIKPEEGPPVQASQGISSQAEEGPKTSPDSEVGGKPFAAQTIQEQSTEPPRKKLVCPICGIIYERGDSCVRCGSSLAPQTPSQEKEKPKLSEAEAVPTSPPPKVSEDIPKMALDQDLTLASKEPPLQEPPLPSPKGQDLGVSQPVKRKKVPTSLEELFQEESLEQPSAKKATDPIEKRTSSAKKPKRDYRRLALEVGGVAVIALAGGYFLWSVFFHLTVKEPELRALPSKETVSQVLPASSSAHPAATATESGGLKSGEESSTPSKEAAPSLPSLPDDSKTPSPEVREIRSIKALLEHIRQANLQKDIDLFVSCYASDFRNLDARKRATLAYWEKFNYVHLSYDLKDLSISDETAKARVEWLIKTSAKTGSRPQENRSVLYVTFKKEDGGWRIKEVKVAK